MIFLLSYDSHSHKTRRNYKRRRIHFHDIHVDGIQRIFVIHNRSHPTRCIAFPSLRNKLAQESPIPLVSMNLQVTDICRAMIFRRRTVFCIILGLQFCRGGGHLESPPRCLYGEAQLHRLPSFLPIHRDIETHADNYFHGGIPQGNYRLELERRGSILFLDQQKDVHRRIIIINNTTGRIEKNTVAAASGTWAEDHFPSFWSHRPVHRPIEWTRDALGLTFPRLCYQPLGAAEYIPSCSEFPVPHPMRPRSPTVPNITSNESATSWPSLTRVVNLRTRCVAGGARPARRIVCWFLKRKCKGSDGECKEWLCQWEGGKLEFAFATTIDSHKEEGEYFEWSATGIINLACHMAHLSLRPMKSRFSFRRRALLMWQKWVERNRDGKDDRVFTLQNHCHLWQSKGFASGLCRKKLGRFSSPQVSWMSNRTGIDRNSQRSCAVIYRLGLSEKRLAITT